MDTVSALGSICIESHQRTHPDQRASHHLDHLRHRCIRRGECEGLLGATGVMGDTLPSMSPHHTCTSSLLTMQHPCCTLYLMTSLKLLTTHITDLSSEGTVTHVNAIGDDVEVWLSIPTYEGTEKVIRHIPCRSHQQAENIARLWKALWY